MQLILTSEQKSAFQTSCPAVDLEMQHGNVLSMRGPHQLAIVPQHSPAAYTMAANVPQQAYGITQLGLNNGGALDRKLTAKLAEIQIRPEDMKVARNCFKHLTQAAKQLGEGWCIRPFGSISNGFCKHGCDLDATCCWDGTTNLSTLPEPSQLLEGFLPIIKRNEAFHILKDIKFARVPILKLKFVHQEEGQVREIEVDLSFQNTEPLPNTQLLRSYSILGQQGERQGYVVRDLGLLVKLWAEAAGVCGAPNGNLSAYSFTLMAIYFMQVDPNVRLPCLPTHCFNGGDLPPQQFQQLKWTCALPMSWLLYQFFRFFVGDFQWGTEVVSVRIGRRATADDPAFSQLRGRFDPRLHIEDPFLTERNLHCVLRPDQERLLCEKLWEAAEAMQHGVLPNGLWCSSPDTGTWVPRLQLGENTTAEKGTNFTSLMSSKLAGSTKNPPRELGVKPPAPKDLPMTKLLQGRWAF